MIWRSWTASCLWNFTAAVVYFASLNFADARAAKRSTPPLDDVGFEMTPEMPCLQELCDGAGAVGFLYALFMLRYGSKLQRERLRALVDYHGLGNVFSSSLHAVTILPSPEFPSSTLPLMGGTSDKLMSNHVFNYGILLHYIVLSHCERWRSRRWLLPLGVGLYSAALLCTRSHYSVDIVLAWWVLGALLKLDPTLLGHWLF